MFLFFACGGLRARSGAAGELFDLPLDPVKRYPALQWAAKRKTPQTHPFTHEPPRSALSGHLRASMLCTCDTQHLCMVDAADSESDRDRNASVGLGSVFLWAVGQKCPRQNAHRRASTKARGCSVASRPWLAPQALW